MEDQLRRRLGQHPTPIDVDALWDKVEPRLPKKKRHVLPFWFWLVAGIALSGSLLLLFTSEDNALPLAKAAGISSPPLQAEKPAPSPVVDLPTPAPRSPAVATDGTATNIPIPKSAPALKTARTPKTKAAALKPSTPVMEREAQMIYTKVETPGPEINTPRLTETLTPYVTSGEIAGDKSSLQVAVQELNQKTITALKYPLTQERPKLPEKSTPANSETAPAVREAGTPAKIVESQVKESPKREPQAKKEAARTATVAAKNAKEERREAAKKLLEAGIMARQEQAAEKKAIRAAQVRAARDAAIRRFDEKSKTKVSSADQKTTQKLALIKARKTEKKQRDIEKMEAERAEILARQRQNNDNNEQLMINAYTRRKAMEARLAARAARRAERELAKARKAEKPGKIRDNNPAYWTIEPGIALSLPASSGGGGDGSGNEKALEGIHLQGLVGYHRAGGLSMRTGLMRSRINSKVDSEITRSGSQPQEAVVAIIENANGSRTEQRGTVQVATTETVTTKYYNSVSSTDIPLLIGYRFAGNRWGLTVEAGPTFNLSSGGEAHRYNGTGFVAVEGDYFRNKLEGSGFLANFGGAYQLTAKTSLTANLRFQSFGSGGFENPDVSPASTNYSLLGVQLGYRIRF